MFTVRPMDEEDIPAALDLWQGFPGIGRREADRPAALAKYLRRNPGCSYVAHATDGKFAGVRLAGHDGRRGHLHHVAVADPYRNRGLGRELVERCTAAPRAWGIEKINLRVNVDKAAGRAFWNRLGRRERDAVVLVSVIPGDEPNA
jgi:ribosomal protein S18 acetylase RimI-like enzyme